MEYIIRSVRKDLTSYNGFQWKEKGIVTCDDWSPSPTCGAGLHGLRLQQNDPGTWYDKVLVLEVDEHKIVNIGDKCKFPKAKVVHCGDMTSVTSFLLSKNANIEGMYQRTQISSDCVKWIGGYGSNLTGGDRSKLTGGDRSKLTGGDCSTLTGGDNSILTGGNNSTLTGGDGSILIFDGNKYRIYSAYVGENGILPNVHYELNSVGEFVRV